MNKKKTFGGKVEDFMAGKGFYIVLFVCVAIIGISAWALLFAGNFETGVQTGYTSGDIEASVPEVSIPDINGGDIETGAEDVTLPDSVETGAWEDNESTETAVSSQPANTAPSQSEAAVITPEKAAVTIADLDFIWPLSGEIAVGYSMDSLIYDKTMADWRTHNGIDIAAQIGTKVLSVAAGTVENIYDDDLMGTTVIINHAEGLRSIYSNLAAKPAVKIGDTIEMGTVIGAVGDTAVGETGEVAHLHFGATLDGASVDPAGYLPKK